MSKANPPVQNPVDHANYQPRTYVIGEKVYYFNGGVQLPCVVVGTKQTGNAPAAKITYTVQGDISGTGYPGNQPTGPFSQITEDQLSDRTTGPHASPYK